MGAGDVTRALEAVTAAEAALERAHKALAEATSNARREAREACVAAGSLPMHETIIGGEAELWFSGREDAVRAGRALKALGYTGTIGRRSVRYRLFTERRRAA